MVKFNHKFWTRNRFYLVHNFAPFFKVKICNIHTLNIYFNTGADCVRPKKYLDEKVTQKNTDDFYNNNNSSNNVHF